MPSRSSGPARRPVMVAQCLLCACVAVAVLCAASARAADYRMVLCAANNGSNSYATATNTVSGPNPGGIFEFHNWCGPAPYPAGESAYLRINENQASGNAGETAYGSISWTAPPWVAILAAGGYTREPNAFNEGWRARFWAEGFDGSTNNILMQGSGVANGSLGGIGWATTSTFAPHLWPFGGYGSYRRFVFELTCVRPAGCDRSNYNAVDANTMVLILTDTSPPGVGLSAGQALSGGWVRGAQTLSWSSSDQGSGMRFERLRIDGSLISQNDYRGQCDIDSNGAVGEFARVFSPCPAGGPWGHGYTLDTAGLADGAHTLQVCAQDYAQSAGLDGTGGESCDQRTIHTDNTAPGAPAGLEVTSANPQRYLQHFGAHWQLPPNAGSPISKVHYNIVNAANEVVVPEQTVSGTNLSALSNIEGPSKAGDYRLRLWLEDEVGFQGPATTAQIPHDTTPPAAPQELSVTPPATSRAADGFDLRWRDVADAGSPITSAHYQVLNAAGAVVVPTQTVGGEGVQAVQNLETPQQSGDYTVRLWLEDEEGNVGVPATAPLAYECLRSDVGDGTALSSGLGANAVGEEVVQQGQGGVLRGRLSGADGGVAGAPICVFSRVLTDRQREFLGLAVSGPDGSYQFAIPAGASRQLSVRYRSGDREVGAEATIQTVVHPTFKAARPLVHNEHFARFSGEIPGPDNNRVVVVLQVKSGKGWRAFRRYRTREDGRFLMRYRFTRTTTRTPYVMRAQVRVQGGYPYLQGNSRSLVLHVVP
jgi:hypothetical protein